MYRNERGMTLIGWLIVLAFGGLFLLGGMRLGPVYFQHMKLTSAMNRVAADLSGQNATVLQVTNALADQYNIEDISYPDFNDIKIRKEGAGLRIVAKYDHVVPYLSNVHFLVAFDDYVDIPR